MICCMKLLISELSICCRWICDCTSEIISSHRCTSSSFSFSTDTQSPFSSEELPRMSSLSVASHSPFY